MTAPQLDPLYSVAEVAASLGATPAYVKARCRAREWPHKRGARGAISFSAADYAEILRLMAAPIEERPAPRMAFAPRARRSA